MKVDFWLEEIPLFFPSFSLLVGYFLLNIETEQIGNLHS